ncbi:DNA-directed DNA polymerase II small subunit, partial [Methanothermococcus sp. SCGC AD-155-M21]|nr:DNA-directed DNA polymerase II small subunit [Methanothermococcus sp. SCGC AD-155-M21]MBW9221216.1 DNA-directed DNA polymerase II small subunit [Methanothermococcus sp. SCGC AD-155-M21]
KKTYKNFNFLDYYIPKDNLKNNQNKEEREPNLDGNRFKIKNSEINNITNEINTNMTNKTNNIANENNITNNITNNIKNEIKNKNNEGIEVENKYTPINSENIKLENERKKRISQIKSIRNSINNKINYISKDIDSKIKIYDQCDITGKSTCEGSIEDFIKYFKSRYNKIKSMIEKKINRRAYPLNRIYKRKGENDVFVVGIVSDVNTTTKGHKRVEIEDENTTFTVILMKDKIAKGDLPNDILLDEVIGFIGYVPDSGNIMFANECIRPDLTLKKPKSTEEKIYAAFLSDIHVGSYEFLEDSFRKFIRFLNGDVKNGLEEKIVSRLKYISIAGDLIDGVGIYPGQEYDLYDVDVISQYSEIAAYVEQIPEHIHVIISPGNHDALRPAEPQPVFPSRILNLFDGLDNITFLSNPGHLNVHGLDFLVYHGRSFDDIIGQISSAKYTEPVSIMKELLKRRHLCPTYGGRCPIAPEDEDYLVIHNEPDVFHTGHIHINGYGNYKGTIMVNSGTFQEQTEFQKKMGIHPTPARVPILDLSKTAEQYIEWNNGKLTVK